MRFGDRVKEGKHRAAAVGFAGLAVVQAASIISVIRTGSVCPIGLLFVVFIPMGFRVGERRSKRPETNER
jgi:hypothetical protein